MTNSGNSLQDLAYHIIGCMVSYPERSVPEVDKQNPKGFLANIVRQFQARILNGRHLDTLREDEDLTSDVKSLSVKLGESELYINYGAVIKSKDKVAMGLALLLLERDHASLYEDENKTIVMGIDLNKVLDDEQLAKNIHTIFSAKSGLLGAELQKREDAQLALLKNTVDQVKLVGSPELLNEIKR